MAVRELKPQTISVDDAVELIWARVLSGEFENLPLAVRTLWPELVFSAQDFDYLALFGLTELSRLRSRESRQHARKSPGVSWGAPHGKKWDKYVALTWTYERADGSAAPLVEFGADDLVAFSRRCGVLAQAYKRRQKWANTALDALKEHGCDRLKELPASALAELNESAAEAMGKQA